MKAASLEEFSQHIVGNWTLCGQTSVFGTHEQGLAIAADGTWRKLYEQDGTAGSDSANDTGTWEVIDTSAFNGPGWYQLNLNSAQGSVLTHPDLADWPRKMRLDNSGVFVADYVIDQGGAPPPPMPAQHAVSYPPRTCDGSAASQNGFANANAARSALIGRWLTCRGSVFGSSDEVGLEIKADGTWHKLYPVSEGMVVEGRGFEREGRWSLVDLNGANGPGSFQVNLEHGGFIYSPLVADTSPRRLRLDNSGVFTGEYAIDP